MQLLQIQQILTICSYHVTCAFQSESTLYNYLMSRNSLLKASTNPVWPYYIYDNNKTKCIYHSRVCFAVMWIQEPLNKIYVTQFLPGLEPPPFLRETPSTNTHTLSWYSPLFEANLRSYPHPPHPLFLTAIQTGACKL